MIAVDTSAGRSVARLQFLDALRGLAALSVVVWHVASFSSRRAAEFGAAWFDLGRFGVCTFFLVSGFIIPQTLEGSSTTSFVIRRVFRIFPLYWLSLVGILVLALFLGQDILPTDFSSELPGSALANATLLQQLAGVPHAIPLYYTLTVELVWYATCVALYSVRWLDRIERLSWLVIAGFTLLCVVTPLVLDRRVPFSLPYYGTVLMLGSALNRHSQGDLRTQRLLALLSVGVGTGIAAGWIAQHRFSGALESGLNWKAAVAPWVAAYVVVLLAYRFRDRPWPAVLVWMGVISYSLYLLHWLTLTVFLEAEWPAPLVIASVLLSSVAVSALAWRFVELPSQAIGRRLSARP